ncbi:MAG: GNAT family N-acetyltransferase [Gammaproteobacteria bacterium]
MKIRIAEPRDLESIVAIYNQSIAAGRRTADLTAVSLDERIEWFEDHPADRYPVLVADQNGAITGYLTISAYRPGRGALRHTAEVSFFVAFDSHRRGVASSLLRHALDLCPSLQIKTLFAILIDGNEASMRLLEKFGFERWGYLPRVAEFDGAEFGHLYYGRRVREP